MPLCPIIYGVRMTFQILFLEGLLCVAHTRRICLLSACLSVYLSAGSTSLYTYLSGFTSLPVCVLVPVYQLLSTCLLSACLSAWCILSSSLSCLLCLSTHLPRIPTFLSVCLSISAIIWSGVVALMRQRTATNKVLL